MDPHTKYYYSIMINNKSENYQKLQSLCNDIKRSWINDCDETESMKEIIELIKGMLIMSSLEEYFSNNKNDLDYFMGEFTKEVIFNILTQPVIFGDNGDQIGLDLIFHFIKLFMHFHKNKEYAPLFEKIRKIFSKDYSTSLFNPNSKSSKKENNPKKGYTYEQFNEEFCKDFKKEKINFEPFNIGDKVDVSIKYKSSRSTLDNNAWVRGIIIDIKDNEYIIEYPNDNLYDNKINYPFDSPNVLKEGTKTEDWDWRLSLKENDIIDCYDRSRWFPATICKVIENKNKNGLIYREYKVGFRIYQEYFLENKEYDYNTFLQCTIFWDYGYNLTDSNGNSFYGDNEVQDEKISFYSKRIQKFQKYTSIQREILSNKYNNLYNSYSNINLNMTMNNMMTIMNQKTEGEEKMKMYNEILKNDQNETNIDNLYLYEKDGKKNIIIGKNNDNFYYYFALLLKKMADNGYFEEMMNILKDKPTVEEVYNIFFILMYCTSYIHKDYFQENYNIFKKAFFNMMDNLSSKEVRNLHKEVIDIINSFFIKINYVISPNKNIQKTNIDEMNLELSIKMIKSSIFDKKIQGLKGIGEFINKCPNEEKKKNLINLIIKNDLIKELFGPNYHTQILSKSDKILKLLLKYNEITEDDIKLIWSLTEQGDLEAKMTIIRLLNDLIVDINENNSNIILGCIKKEKEIDKKLNENEIELIYNLSIKGKNELFMMKCCVYYCKNVLEIKNMKNLEKNPIVERLVNLFFKGEKYAQIEIDIFENDLKKNKNVLPIYFLLDKIVEKYRKNILINSENNKNRINDSDYIYKSIDKLINNDKLLKLFKDNIFFYKKMAKENTKETSNQNNLIIDGFTHEENMKYRVLFLIKSIQTLYPKFDFFELLKNICINNPVFQSDKLFFYDFIKKYILENDSTNSTKEKKFDVETQLFNMLTEDNKKELTSSQFNLYIEVFLEINRTKEFLSFYKNANEEYTISINYGVNIDNIFGIEKIWDLLFHLNNEQLIQKLINIIYSLYKSKEEIQKLMNKCVDIIKDIENITFTKLEKCINILKYIIKESEINEFILIKSHNNLTKDCIINITIEQENKNNNNDLMKIFHSNKEKDENSCLKDFLYGNTYIKELKKIIAEKYNLDKNNISLRYEYKENNNLKNKILDSSSNKSLKEILKLEKDNISKKKLISINRFILSGEKIEKDTIIGNSNSKFNKMIKEWFYFFSNGNEIMDKDNILNYISLITSSKNIDDNNLDYQKFLNECDKGEKGFILEEEFIDYYDNLTRTDPEKIKQNIKIMKYGEDFKKIDETSPENNIDKIKLPRYLLGNDEQFHYALIRLFSKFEKNFPIYEFLFFLSTNEKQYNELLENFSKFFKDDNNYLEQLYELIIIESFIQDLEINVPNFKQILNKNIHKLNKKENNKMSIILSQKYLPFDSEDNLIKKKSFINNLLEKEGYSKLINYLEGLLDYINNNDTDEEKIKFECCKKCLKIINSIYNSFLDKNYYNENNNNINIFYLGNSFLNYENNNKENEIIKLKNIILNIPYLNLIKKLLSFLIKFQYSLNIQTISKDCFELLIKLITNNELLLKDIKKDDYIKEKFIILIKNDITSSNNEKVFLQTLIIFVNRQSNNKNKLILDFFFYLYHLSNSIFKELINNKNKQEINSYSYNIFFDYFSNLFQIILNNIKYDDLNNNLVIEFIIHIYNLVFNDLKETNKKKKLLNDTLLGYMKILITAIKSNPLIKNEIISRKIDKETLFEYIYNIILTKKYTSNNINKENNDEKEIDNLILNLNYISENDKFIKIENINEIINNFDIYKKNQNEEEISQNIYDIFNEFIIICLSENAEPEFIIKLLQLFNSKNNLNYNQQNNIKKQKIPKAFGHVGLKNNGCICYLNSILQQMYMVPSFRYAIMSVDDKKDKNNQMSLFFNNHFDDNLLHQLQKMYIYLTYSEKQAFNPKDFCSSFKDFDGAPINPMIQQDSQEFYNNLCDKIENNLKNTKYKYIIDNIFTGKTCSSVTCEKCNTVSYRFEDFYNLSLEVKNISNLYESMQQLIEPEKIESFNCEVCKQKVNIIKRTSLAKLPNVLFIHLKRFYMNYEFERTEKINSKFEFPNTLNLRRFCIEELNKNNKKGYQKEPDEIYPKEDYYYEYELKGINVHIGSAQGGHYVSFIDVERDGHDNEPNIKSSIENNIIKTKWLKFNDAIVTEFNTNDIPIESYGFFDDNKINNENGQNAYLLIYERKKKTPIKIVLDKEKINYFSNIDKYTYNNNIISFGTEQKSIINKFYDISYSNNDKKIDEKDLYNLIFYEEETKECYSYIPYYNIEKIVLKDTFTEIMEKNIKFFRRKANPIEKIKYKDECNDILLKNINLKDFNILDNKFSISNKRQLISFLKAQIFNNKIYKNNHLIIDDGEKIIANYHTTTLLQKLVLPIINIENKEEENEILIELKDIFLLSNNLEKIFETKNICRVFDINNVKLMSEIIYSLMSYINNNKEDIKSAFIKIYKIMEESSEETNNLLFDDDSNEEKSQKDKIISSPLYYLFELIYKIIRINDNLTEFLINQDKVSDLFGKINTIDSFDIRDIIYNIIIYLINHCYDYTWIKNKLNNMSDFEKSRIWKIVFTKNPNKKLMKKLFNEKIELLGKLIILMEYNNQEDSQKLNLEIIPNLFEYALKNKKVTQLLDLLLKIININDDYTLDRLYLLMGFPEIIIKHQIKDGEEEEEDEKNNNEIKENKKKEKENKKFFPLFGNRLLKESRNGEIYKYVNRINQNFCILNQLFPCISEELFKNENNFKKQNLNEEERKKYIFQLLCLSLLDEGNYCLFKYIYLTQSRFIIKYNNLYEEIIDILSKENKYDLDEIKKNADICIKRVNFEINRIENNFNLKTKQKLDDEDYDENNIQEKEEANKIINEIPELPEKMLIKYKENKKIEKFSGFIPKHLPDSIEKIEYNLMESKDDFIFIKVNYFSTFQDIDTLKKQNISEINKKIVENDEYNINEINDIENNDRKIFDVNQIKIGEKLFLENAYSTLISKEKITIKDKLFRSNEEVKLSLVRYIVFNNNSVKSKIKCNISNRVQSDEIKFNNYIPSFSYFCIEEKEYTDYLRIYRRNKKLDFLKDNSICINIKID